MGPAISVALHEGCFLLVCALLALPKAAVCLLSHNMVVVETAQLCAWTAHYSGNLSCEHDTSPAREDNFLQMHYFPRELPCKPYYY